MSINALRATILAAGAATVALATGPAQAQADRGAVLNILVECAKIDDPTARLACYDNNIKNAGGVVRSTVPGRTVALGGTAPLTDSRGASGFGGETVRTGPDRFRAPAGQLDSIRPKITAVQPREPGIYLVMLEDGAQWQFAEGVSQTFRVPRIGSIVEIERGSLGSFLMRIDGQEPIPVRRLR